MGIYDAMKLCKADVSTVCFGLAASMGAFLLASGTKGKRFCMPNARVMIHQPLGTAGGKVNALFFRNFLGSLWVTGDFLLPMDHLFRAPRLYRLIPPRLYK